MGIVKPEMINDKITRCDVLPLSYLKKTSYTGSKRGLRYKLCREERELAPETAKAADGTEGSSPVGGAEETAAPLKKETVLCCSYWSGPFAYDETAPEEMTKMDFPFSDEGIDAAIAYLNAALPAVGQ